MVAAGLELPHHRDGSGSDEITAAASNEAVSCRVSDGKPFENRGSDFKAHQ